jgi:TIGR01777 family protein
VDTRSQDQDPGEPRPQHGASGAGAFRAAQAAGGAGVRIGYRLLWFAGDEILTESSAPGADYLAEVCQEWEKQAAKAESLGIRVARIRTGVVLGKGGGALEKMLPPFKMFVGGRIGSGKQWMSWIHLDDLVGIICHALINPMNGPFNGTAPNPVTNAQFTSERRATLGRPALFPVPAFALKTMFGEMSEMLLGGQRVLPEATKAAGYRFQYPELGPALRHILA